MGTHLIYFQIQVRLRDNILIWSEETFQTLTIDSVIAPTQTPDPNENTLQLSLVLAAIFIIAILFGIGYYLIYLGRPSLGKIEKDLLKRRFEEAKNEAEEEKEKEQKRKEKKPFLKLEISTPLRLWGSKSSMAEGKIRNAGVASARDVQISVVAAPGLALEKSAFKFSEILPSEEKPLVFPFMVENQIKRGNYKLRFEVKSKQTSSRVKDRSLRAIRIGFLSDAINQKNTELLTTWFKKQTITWDDLTGAGNFLKLLDYDLIIMAFESAMPPKWAKNISNFVDQSQSLLAIGKINYSNIENFSQVLGFSKMIFKEVTSTERQLIISDNQHEATKAFKVGDRIQSQGQLTSNVCVSSVETGQVLATLKIKEEVDVQPKTFPGIVANRFGEGRVIYLNFSLEETLVQQERLLLRIFNWLILKEETSS
jgi:hypothetical protein